MSGNEITIISHPTKQFCLNKINKPKKIAQCFSNFSHKLTDKHRNLLKIKTVCLMESVSLFLCFFKVLSKSPPLSRPTTPNNSKPVIEQKHGPLRNSHPL